LALSGSGSILGPLLLSGSVYDASASSSGIIAPPSFSVTNSTLNLAIVSPTGTNISTPTLNVGSASTLNIASLPLVTGYPTTYHLITGATVNGTLNFVLGTLPTVNPPYAGYVTNRAAAGTVDLVLTGGPIPVRSLSWSGLNNGNPDGTWDVATTPAWLDTFNSPTIFNQNDIVVFNDSAAGQTSINMNTTVTPGSLTVTNNTLTYTLGGGGKISGPVSLTKLGSGRLILDEAGGNDFSGGVTIGAGTLQVGSNDSAGNLPPTGNIVDNGTLLFARADIVTVTNTISGTGAVTQNSSGYLVLGGANTFTGAVTVVQGTLQLGNSSALGTTNGSTTVVSGATLDFMANANNIGQEQVFVSGTGVFGQGALFNSSGSAAFVGPNVARVTLTGDTTFGGSGRWDLRAATTSNPNLASLSTGGVARKIIKVGANQVGVVGVTVDPALSDIEVQSGTFSMEAATTGLGNPANTMTVFPGGTFQMFAITNLLDKVISLGSDGVINSVSATSGSNTVVGPITLTNDCFFNVNNTAVSLNLNDVITGPGQLKKVGAGLLNLSGNSPAYAGGLQAAGGTLELSGSLNNALGVVVTVGEFLLNGSLLGSAIVSNNVNTVIAGFGATACPFDILGNLNPGDTNVPGTLTMGSLVLETGAVLTYDLGSANTPGGGTNDLIIVNGDLTVNGNTVFVNPLGLLLSGVPYRLFNYTGNLIWNSDLQVQNVGTATYTFTVDTNTPGQINLLINGGPPVWSGASPTDSYWSDAANWHGSIPTAGNPVYFGGTTRLNNTNDTTTDTSYGEIGFALGASAFVLNGNALVPVGRIINFSSSQQTINLGLDFSDNFTMDGGAAGLTIGGGLTNTAANPVKTTTTLAGTGTLTNLLASIDPTGTNTIFMATSDANWTLVDNASSTLITVPWAFDIRAGTFNFGTASSAPSLSSTTVNGGPQDNQVGLISGAMGTFNMVNGTLTTVARLNTATAANSTGIINQSGGTMNIGQQFQGANGGNANEVSQVNISGGTMNVGGGTGQFYNASRGTGTLTVSGSGTLNCGTLDVSRSIVSGTAGTVNLNGGTLKATRVGTATANQSTSSTGSTATFNFNGGTLKAGANSATFFQGSTVAPIIPIISIVKSGGAMIDDGGFAISILEPLQHDPTLSTTPDGGLSKLGSGTVTLTATNSYTGGTLVNNGTLAINGSLTASAVTVAAGGTLAGTGSVATNVTVNAGGTIAPAGNGVLGTFTILSNAFLNGTAAMDINSVTGTNDVLKAGAITYGGTLAVTNLGAASLRSGASFRLFNAGAYSGAFATLQLPSLWPGLSWNTSALNISGTINVTGTIIPPQIGSTSVSGNAVTLSGAGGPAGATYYVLESTNAALPLAQWTRVATNTFDGSGNFSWTGTPHVPVLPAAFYLISAP
jgi:autotransporter-associated beta strand protein